MVRSAGYCYQVRDSDPRWVRVAYETCKRHPEISLFSLKDREPQTRNDNRQLTIWQLQEAFRKLNAYDAQMRRWKRWRAEKNSGRIPFYTEYRPVDTRPMLLLRLRSAWETYQYWE